MKSAVDLYALAIIGAVAGVIASFLLWQFFEKHRSPKYIFAPKRSARQSAALCSIIAAVVGVAGYFIPSVFLAFIAIGLLSGGIFFIQVADN